MGQIVSGAYSYYSEDDYDAQDPSYDDQLTRANTLYNLHITRNLQLEAQQTGTTPANAPVTYSYQPPQDEKRQAKLMVDIQKYQQQQQRMHAATANSNHIKPTCQKNVTFSKVFVQSLPPQCTTPLHQQQQRHLSSSQDTHQGKTSAAPPLLQGSSPRSSSSSPTSAPASFGLNLFATTSTLLGFGGGTSSDESTTASSTPSPANLNQTHQCPPAQSPSPPGSGGGGGLTIQEKEMIIWSSPVPCFVDEYVGIELKYEDLRRITNQQQQTSPTVLTSILKGSSCYQGISCSTPDTAASISPSDTSASSQQPSEISEKSPSVGNKTENISSSIGSPSTGSLSATEQIGDPKTAATVAADPVVVSAEGDTDVVQGNLGESCHKDELSSVNGSISTPTPTDNEGGDGDAASPDGANNDGDDKVEHDHKASESTQLSQSSPRESSSKSLHPSTTPPTQHSTSRSRDISSRDTSRVYVYEPLLRPASPSSSSYQSLSSTSTSSLKSATANPQHMDGANIQAPLTPIAIRPPSTIMSMSPTSQNSSISTITTTTTTTFLSLQPSSNSSSLSVISPLSSPPIRTTAGLFPITTPNGTTHRFQAQPTTPGAAGAVTPSLYTYGSPHKHPMHPIHSRPSSSSSVLDYTMRETREEHSSAASTILPPHHHPSHAAAVPWTRDAHDEASTTSMQCLSRNNSDNTNTTTITHTRHVGMCVGINDVHHNEHYYGNHPENRSAVQFPLPRDDNDDIVTSKTTLILSHHEEPSPTSHHLNHTDVNAAHNAHTTQQPHVDPRGGVHSHHHGQFNRKPGAMLPMSRVPPSPSPLLRRQKKRIPNITGETHGTSEEEISRNSSQYSSFSSQSRSSTSSTSTSGHRSRRKKMLPPKPPPSYYQTPTEHQLPLYPSNAIPSTPIALNERIETHFATPIPSSTTIVAPAPPSLQMTATTPATAAAMMTPTNSSKSRSTGGGRAIIPITPSLQLQPTPLAIPLSLPSPSMPSAPSIQTPSVISTISSSVVGTPLSLPPLMEPNISSTMQREFQLDSAIDHHQQQYQHENNVEIPSQLSSTYHHSPHRHHQHHHHPQQNNSNRGRSASSAQEYQRGSPFLSTHGSQYQRQQQQEQQYLRQQGSGSRQSPRLSQPSQPSHGNRTLFSSSSSSTTAALSINDDMNKEERYDEFLMTTHHHHTSSQSPQTSSHFTHSTSSR